MPDAAVIRVMTGRSVRALVPDGKVLDRGYHDVTLVDMKHVDDMMGVMTLFEDDQGGYNPPWWPEPSSCACTVRIKGYSVDVVVSCVLRNVNLPRLYLMGVTAVAGVMVSVAMLTDLGGAIIWSTLGGCRL